ncbi:putative RNase H [Trypanosoma cruzi]|uniref:Putative RNase H n=1 Tax=Trypanosoma cruzi TaxID=5693 RepID=A0A2V2X7K1_TRYCR|nr:putative RNase H [Trypanosoma cruzi]
MRAGRSVHRQFCYGHCGVHANEPAAQHATQTMATGQHTEHGIAPIWHTGPLTCFATQPCNKWRCAIRQATHRYSLCGARKRSPPLQDQPTSTGTPVDTQETFRHPLLECPGTSAARQRPVIEEDPRSKKFSQWQLLHSRKLFPLLNRLLGTRMALYS